MVDNIKHTKNFMLQEMSQISIIIFQEVSQLVSGQGEMINRMENFVYEAQAKTEKGKSELVSARENKKKAFKKKIILGIILSVIALIIILVIIFSVCEC